MDPTSIKEELSCHKESEGEQATEDRENSDEASNLTTPLSAPNGKQNNAAKRPTQLNRCDSVGTESESSSRTNSPQMERPSYKQSRKVSSQSDQKTPNGSEFEEDENEDLEEGRKITVGVCAMNKKTYSRPMKQILTRLRKSNLLHFEVFQDEMILNEDVENWPIVDCLISFYSTGFPLHKAIKYTELRKPFLLNDLETQYLLMDRRKVYEMLVDAGIQVPRYAVFNRDENNKPADSENDLIECDDTIEINGQIFTKPFVEKPVSAEDHNIYIYYPLSAGGGCQILFRKIGSRSSVYSSESRVRRTGSYIYEEYMATSGTDVKVYTVGEEYAHSEARKSPALDGKVERDAQGKEIRYPVILSASEKLIAKQVCSIFKQTVCGFDLLRSNGKSYVCDVNGFSFVKTSQKYYDDCSQILADIIFQNLAPQLWIPNPLIYQLSSYEEEPVMTTEGTMLELRCVVAIIRHGDRTPKQKMKMIVHHKLWFDLFYKFGGPEEGKLKLKAPKDLQEVLDITRNLLRESQEGGEIRENPAKLMQMKSVLEMYGHFSGINRKLQLKSLNDKRNIDMKKKFKGRNKDSDPLHDDSNNPTLLLILKWGGELTPMGKKQAEELGRAFRCMYPGGQGEYGLIPGCGFLRLHSTYRHDLKIYASDEGRVQMTAAAFAKGLLQLEGELPPILASLVKNDKYVNGMLDTTADVSLKMLHVKSELHHIMHIEDDFTEEQRQQLAPTNANSLLRALNGIKNPHLMCEKVYDGVKSLTAQISALCEKPDVDPNAPILYHDESIRLMEHRWQKLEKDFKMGDGKYDISLIPDIYDCVKYDYLHNRSLGLKNIPELFEMSKSLADIVIPQEYGITKKEKLDISKQVCNRLLKKIRADLKHTVDNENETVHRLDPRYSKDVVTPHRHVRTRLYFTSESHVHCMLAGLRYGEVCDEINDEQWKRACDYIGEVSELSYLTQIVLMQYEDPMADPHSDNRFHVELYFSPGLKTPDQIIKIGKRKADTRSGRNQSNSKTEEDYDKRRAKEKSSHTRTRRSSDGDNDTQSIVSAVEHRMPVTVLQYNKAITKGLRSSPPPMKFQGPAMPPPYVPKYSLRSIKSIGGSRQSSSQENLRTCSAPLTSTSQSSIFSTPSSLRAKKNIDPLMTRSVGLLDIVETVPSLHPLISLHSSISMKNMDSYLAQMTSDLDDDEILNSSDLTTSLDRSRLSHQESIPY
eukprot:gene1302-15691_t